MLGIWGKSANGDHPVSRPRGLATNSRGALLGLQEAAGVHRALMDSASTLKKLNASGFAGSVLLFQPFFGVDSGGRMADVSLRPLDSRELGLARSADSSLAPAIVSEASDICQPGNVGLSYLVATRPDFYDDSSQVPHRFDRVRVSSAYDAGNELDQRAMAAFKTWEKGSAEFSSNHVKRYAALASSLPPLDGRPDWNQAFISQVPLRLPIAALSDSRLPQPCFGSLYYLSNSADTLPHSTQVGAAAAEVAEVVLRERLKLTVARGLDLGAISKLANAVELDGKAPPETHLHKRPYGPGVEALGKLVGRLWVDSDYLWPPSTWPHGSRAVRPSSPLQVVSRTSWGQDGSASQRRRRVIGALMWFLFRDERLVALADRILMFTATDLEVPTQFPDRRAETSLSNLTALLNGERPGPGHGCYKPNECLCSPHRNPLVRTSKWASNYVPKLIRLCCASTDHHWSVREGPPV